MNNELVFYILDTETTGLNIVNHEIVEISIIRCKDKVQLSKIIRAKWPYNASLDALKITHKTLADLNNGISHPEAIEATEQFFADDGGTPNHRVIIAHNSPFDRKFLFKMWERENKIFPANLWLDSIQLMREYAKNCGIIKPKVNLTASLEMLKIASKDRMHSAMGDARNTYRLWTKLIQEHNIDYLPFIKKIPQVEEEENLNELLDNEDC